MLSLFLTRAIRRWRQIVLIAAPLILLPLIITVSTPESKCAYVVLLVTIYWVSSAVPLAVASLLPLVLFPLLGILPSDKICLSYMKESNVMLLAGIIAAIAIESCNLHRRIALRILLLAGTSPKWLMLSFMATTAFLSMWINNTAAASLMVPIVESILEEISNSLENDSEKYVNDTYSMKSNNSNTALVHIAETPLDAKCLEEPAFDPSIELLKRKAAIAARMERYRKCTLLSVAYASNFGGAATVTGTGPNLVLMEVLANLYPNAQTGLTFATWMLFAVPCSLLCLLLCWIWLLVVFLGPRSLLCETTNIENRHRVKSVIRTQYRDLGAINFHQMIISVLFTLLVFLWVFRQPEFMPGWSSLFPEGIKDSVAGIGVVFIMFAVPSRLDFICCDCSQDEPPPRALTWPAVQKKVPWGILLLMGGGFALADGSKASGLSKWLGSQLTILSPLPPPAVVTIIVIVTAFLTEIASNTATATILMPVLGDMSESIKVHPIYLMLPSTIACSFAFMLPIATPPNAIVYEICGMSTWDMIKPGFVSNLLCLGVLILMINTLGVCLFNLNEYPTWATQRVILNTTCIT